jgi:hypothetical protein
VLGALGDDEQCQPRPEVFRNKPNQALCLSLDPPFVYLNWSGERRSGCLGSLAGDRWCEGSSKQRS